MKHIMPYIMFIIPFIALTIAIPCGYFIPKYYAWKNSYPNQKICKHDSKVGTRGFCKICGYIAS